MTEHPTLGDFILGFEGLGIMRSWTLDPAGVKARVRGIVEMASRLEEEPWSSPVVVGEKAVTDGYAEWAAVYDAPGNPVVLAEEPVVREVVSRYPVGDALDAACGTGRHAAHLASAGHRVVGIDATPEMLEHARAKVPSARFETGDLTALPLPDGAVDLAVCSFALTHCADLGPPVSELARVVRPGGHVVVSDAHPFSVYLGAQARYRAAERGFVRNHVHLASDYLAAFQAAGLEVVRCVEPLWGDREIATFEFAADFPDMLDASVRGLPIVIVWELEKRG
ncbi:MAG: class I SAM-dependent methyltransferase [Chloroflexota bacterium]|nr:class I SAM-dependent methyltransferase [Chloroflexota bacterium]MDE2884945.1 class I SAM-dependent methyltransferase [Chloroflexota bacterium]